MGLQVDHVLIQYKEAVLEKLSQSPWYEQTTLPVELLFVYKKKKKICMLPPYTKYE